MLTVGEEKFCVHRARPDCKSDLEAYYAAFHVSAGAKSSTVQNRAYAVMQRPEVQARIKELLDEQAARALFTPEQVLREWVDIATADPAELVSTRYLCCRYCHGQNGGYQWRDENEFVLAVQAVLEHNATKRYAKNEKPIPTNEGGYGFRKLREPNPDCPQCEGEGQLDVRINSLDRVSPKSRKLFAGVKATLAGVEVKLRDQSQALDCIAKHFGMYTENLRIIAPTKPQHVGIEPGMSDVEATRKYLEAVSAV